MVIQNEGHPHVVIPNHILEQSWQYKKYHAIISKFMGIWPKEFDILWWIQLKWNPKAPINIFLGAKGFFTVIFDSLEDWKKFLDNKPYLMSSVGLFMRHWKPYLNM